MDKAMCDLCGAEAVHESRPRTFTYKGKSTTFDQPGTYCNTCDEVILSSKDRKETRKIIAEFKAEVDDLAGPEEIRHIRKDILNITQSVAALALGGGPNAFSRYEQGEMTVSGSTSILLRMAERSDDAKEEIKAMILERAKTA